MLIPYVLVDYALVRSVSETSFPDRRPGRHKTWRQGLFGVGGPRERASHSKLNPYRWVLLLRVCMGPALAVQIPEEVGMFLQ